MCLTCVHSHSSLLLLTLWFTCAGVLKASECLFTCHPKRPQSPTVTLEKCGRLFFIYLFLSAGHWTAFLSPGTKAAGQKLLSQTEAKAHSFHTQIISGLRRWNVNRCEFIFKPACKRQAPKEWHGSGWNTLCCLWRHLKGRYYENIKHSEISSSRLNHLFTWNTFFLYI